MYRKIVYIISAILGIFLAIKLVKKLQRDSFEYVAVKDGENPFMKKGFPQKRNKEVLNERQKKILEFFRKKQILFPSDIYLLHPQVSTRTLRRDMSSLVDLNIIKQEGSTRDTKYILIT
jgi:predicted HTH transcriptional regulator